MSRIRYSALLLLCLAAASRAGQGAATSSAALKPAATSRPARTRNVTFLSTSDPHYKAFEARDWNRANRETIEEMNGVATLRWPARLGGDAIEPPRGVLVLGDCIDDGDRVRDGKDYTAAQYKAFVADFGFDGTDGLLKYRIFEGWGNHDGPPAGTGRSSVSFRAELKKRNAVRKAKGWLAGLSDNGLHYSWDWDDVHFVQLNIYPADRQNPKVRYSAKWHDPQGALSFLKKDLARCVGDSGRPVVLMSHCGFDTDWWIAEDWKAAYDAAKACNVVLYLYGHSGTGLRDWAPPGEQRRWTCVNDGQTTSCFFVVQIVGDRIRLACRRKVGQKIVKNADGSFTPRWAGQWTWRFLLDRRITAPAMPSPAAKPALPARRAAATGKGLRLKVDLALPTSDRDPTPLPGTLKPGWHPFVAPRWADMYMHDGVWEDGTGGAPPATRGIGGTGVHVKIDCGGAGNGGFHVYGMARSNLGGGGRPTGRPKGDPIANGWFHNVDWGGERRGDILMRINGLPAGRYELTCYHNHWEPRKQSTRNRLDRPSRMPDLPLVRAVPLPRAPLPGYRGWDIGLGTGKGVTSIREARSIDVTSATSDEKVATSVIRFRTDGSNDVLVIIDGGDDKYPDPARPGREGSKAVLNAFCLEQVK